MRLVINLDCNGEVPYDHQYLLYSSILNSVKGADENLVSKIHDNSHSPRFSLSQLLPVGEREFKGSGIKADRFIFFISSLDVTILEKIKFGIESKNYIIIGNNRMLIHSIKFETPRISSEIVNMISRSPVILKNENKYITTSDENFSTILQNNIISKYKKVTGKEPYIKFIRLTNSKSKLSILKGAGIPSSMLTFTIGANYELLDFIVNVGIGAKTQMGFGYIEEQRIVREHGF